MRSRTAIIALFFLSITLGLSACQGKRSSQAHSVAGLRKIHFDFDSATLRPEMMRILNGNGQYLKSHPSLNVIIEGHCDERGTNEYNLALGDRRAYSTKRYLVNQGIKQSRIRTVSYGEERPISNGHDESSWYMNRRAEFLKN